MARPSPSLPRSAAADKSGFACWLAGNPLQVSSDDADHEQPRWSPDSGSLIYFSPGPASSQQGAIFEIPALGGPPRRIAAALSGGDISHDGQHIAAFQSQ